MVVDVDEKCRKDTAKVCCTCGDLQNFLANHEMIQNTPWAWRGWESVVHSRWPSKALAAEAETEIMALYAIGDLHLAFRAKLKNNCAKCMTPEDTLVLLGDHSWGRNLEEAAPDLAYIEALPGRKILLRGNHDMFWDAKKTEKLNQQFAGRLFFLQNNFYSYGDYALVGTKGFTFEGPFYVNGRGEITGWDEAAKAHADKLIARELQRLRDSFEQAKAAGYTKFILFLHYPPTNILESSSPFTKMAKAYGAEQVVYAHCHGEERFHDSLLGKKRGIRYSLVSGDFLHWQPQRIL